MKDMFLIVAIWLQFSTEEYLKYMPFWAFFVAACMQTICMVALPAPLVPIKLPHTFLKLLYKPHTQNYLPDNVISIFYCRTLRRLQWNENFPKACSIIQLLIR